MTASAELIIKYKDTGANAGLEKLSASAEKVSTKSTAAADKMYKSHVAAERYALASIQHFEQQHEQLKIRSERAIRAEISQTQQAYKNLSASGLYSSRELSRAYDAQIKRVRELRNEMGELTKAQKAMSLLPVAAGAAAAAYTLKSPAQAAMSFDERLANMANTAFSDRGVSGRRAGMKQLESAINKAVGKGGGGTRDQAAEALDAMIAKGVLGNERAINFLPTVMKTAAATNAAPIDIANLSSALVGQKVVKNEKELKVALNMITASGQAGGFEIKDMARWLPKQLPDAGRSGLLGLPGLQKVLTMNQAAILTAGDQNEAGNNVKNLLLKLSSPDTAKDFQRAGRPDLTSYLMNQRLNGVDSVTAWMNIIDSEADKNPKMKAALEKLKKTKDKGQQKEIIDSLSAMSEGSVVGKYFQDMQATGALMGLRNKDVVASVDSAISKNKTEYGVNDKNYDLVSTTSAFKLRQAEQQKDIGQKAAMDELTPYVGKAADVFADIAAKHPLLAGATILATTAVTAFAAATGLAAAVMAGGKEGSALERVGALATSKFGKLGLRAAKVGGVAGVAALAGDYALSAGFGENSAVSRYGSAALNGASIGATVGSIVPGLGTGIGAAVGGGIGLLYQGIQDALKSNSQKPVDLNASMTVGLAPGLVLQSQSMKATGANMQMNTGNVFHGAPG